MILSGGWKQQHKVCDEILIYVFQPYFCGFYRSKVFRFTSNYFRLLFNTTSFRRAREIYGLKKTDDKKVLPWYKLSGSRPQLLVASDFFNSSDSENTTESLYIEFIRAVLLLAISPYF